MNSSIGVASDGTIRGTYYDFRNNTAERTLWPPGTRETPGHAKEIEGIPRRGNPN